jgi:aminoglycoside phosphotransferase (APT) family kinase protein
MTPGERPRAEAAALAVLSGAGLRADTVEVVQASNRLTVRVLPCDVLARVAPESYRPSAEFEVEVARQLAAADAPAVALEPRLEPRVYIHDGFVLNFWTYHEPRPVEDVTARDYAEGLARFHAGMRTIDLATPHFTDRVAEAVAIVSDPHLSPDLPEADRDLLIATLRSTTAAILGSEAPEQLLHGEPHSGNVLVTDAGLLFIDFETCCRGPVEFDVAHCTPFTPLSEESPWFFGAGTPAEVAAHYPSADPALVRTCWVLMLAMVAAWRFDADDRFPQGRRMGDEFLAEIRKATATGGHGLGR